MITSASVSFAKSAAELPPTCSAFAFIEICLVRILRNYSWVRPRVLSTSAEVLFASFVEWHARRDSNPQPAVLETAALPIELLACGSLPQKKTVRSPASRARQVGPLREPRKESG